MFILSKLIVKQLMLFLFHLDFTCFLYAFSASCLHDQELINCTEFKWQTLFFLTTHRFSVCMSYVACSFSRWEGKVLSPFKSVYAVPYFFPLLFGLFIASLDSFNESFQRSYREWNVKTVLNQNLRITLWSEILCLLSHSHSTHSCSMWKWNHQFHLKLYL